MSQYYLAFGGRAEKVKKLLFYLFFVLCYYGQTTLANPMIQKNWWEYILKHPYFIYFSREVRNVSGSFQKGRKNAF